MSSLLVAVSFLTRVPVTNQPVGERDIARSLPWFPVVGAGVGLVTAGIYGIGSSLVPRGMAALIAVAIATLLTGAFHEDGLADTADALGGSFDRDEALRIFKDPRHGSYGVLALVLSIVLRVVAIASLGPLEALAVVPAAHALSRSAALQLLAFLPPAAPGLGASYADATSPRTLTTAAIAAVSVSALFAGLYTFFFLVACIPAVALVARSAARKIQGVTGDILGAAQQLAELSILCVASALIANFDLVWWG